MLITNCPYTITVQCAKYVHLLLCTGRAWLSIDSLFRWQINCTIDAETLGEASAVLAGLFVQTQLCAVVDTLVSLSAHSPSQGGCKGPETSPACSSMCRTTCRPNHVNYGSSRPPWMHTGFDSGAVLRGLLPHWALLREFDSQLGFLLWQKLINSYRAVELMQRN